MAEAILGKKVGMTRIFEENGESVPVTVVECGPCVVLQVLEKSIQLGFDDRSRNASNKPQSGVAKKAKTEPKKFIREVALSEGDEFTIGQEVKVNDVFETGSVVDVIGVSKGKGFAGTLKRFNHASGPRSHGTKNKRAMGSTGSVDQSSTKGRPFPGHMGHERVTQRNLKLVDVDVENNLLLIKGAIPGHRGGYVIVRKTNIV
jgi:large subunit ribosomal protein L3